MTKVAMDHYNKPPCQTYLAHHGILGMKWGVRNGPPYPLGASDHSASERKAGWRKSLDKRNPNKYDKSRSGRVSGRQREAPRKKGLTDKQKRAIKIGAAVAITALAAYGGYKLKQSGKLDPLIEKGRQATRQLLGDSSVSQQKVGSISGFNSTKIPISQRTSEGSFKKLPRRETVEEVISKVNVTKSHNNCYNVVVGTVGRLCGIDMTAKGDTQGGKGLSFEEVCKVFKLDPSSGSDVIHIMSPTVERVSRQIGKRFSEGDVGAIGLGWNNAYKRQAGIPNSESACHTLNWIIRGGKVEFLDSQGGFSGDTMRRIMEKYLDSETEVSFAKFANVEKGLDLETDVDLDALRKFVN